MGGTILAIPGSRPGWHLKQSRPFDCLDHSLRVPTDCPIVAPRCRHIGSPRCSILRPHAGRQGRTGADRVRAIHRRPSATGSAPCDPTPGLDARWHEHWPPLLAGPTEGDPVPWTAPRCRTLCTRHAAGFGSVLCWDGAILEGAPPGAVRHRTEGNASCGPSQVPCISAPVSSSPRSSFGANHGWNRAVHQAPRRPPRAGSPVAPLDGSMDLPPTIVKA